MIALVSRWIHIISVVIAIGGAIFIRIALIPAATQVLSPEVYDTLRSATIQRWKKLVHTCIALLIITGGYNFYMAFQDGVKPMPYHAIFGVKVILALAVFFYAIALTSSGPGFAKLRKNGKTWLGVQIGLAILVILLSGVLKYVHYAPTGMTAA